jgi:hypothetical protein
MLLSADGIGLALPDAAAEIAQERASQNVQPLSHAERLSGTIDQLAETGKVPPEVIAQLLNHFGPNVTIELDIMMSDADIDTVDAVMETISGNQSNGRGTPDPNDCRAFLAGESEPGCASTYNTSEDRFAAWENGGMFVLKGNNGAKKRCAHFAAWCSETAVCSFFGNACDVAACDCL